LRAAAGFAALRRTGSHSAPLFPRSPGFDSPPFVGQTLAETRCLQEPAPCSGYPGASMSAPALFQEAPAVVHVCIRRRARREAPAWEGSAVPVSAWRSCRSAAPGSQLTGRQWAVREEW